MSGHALRYASIDEMPAQLRAQLGVSHAEVGTLATMPKKKYRNQPTVVDGIRFDSKREARYYEQLKLRRAAGEVSYWLRQVPFHMQGGTRYVVDFAVFFVDSARAPAYVDVKGRETPMFRVKRREVQHLYPIKIELA